MSDVSNPLLFLTFFFHIGIAQASDFFTWDGRRVFEVPLKLVQQQQVFQQNVEEDFELDIEDPDASKSKFIRHLLYMSHEKDMPWSERLSLVVHKIAKRNNILNFHEKKQVFEKVQGE